MKIRNIEDLKKNINRSTATIFFIIFSLVLIGLYFTHSKFTQKKTLIDQQKLLFAQSFYKSNLSEKLSIIASSTAFLDYKLGTKNSRDYFFYIYLLLMTCALVLFGTWNWYKLSNVLNKYIANPIKFITYSLKTNNPVHYKDNIEEIRYLISEINRWKKQLSKMKTDENAAKLGRITAQVAHDVRSPLSAIDMTIKNLSNIPENHKTIIHSAVQRISDIANNLLIQYKNPSASQAEPATKNEYIPSILQSIVSEKRSQYSNVDVSFELLIDDNAEDFISCIHGNDFKRILSNLINNAVESLSQSGKVLLRCNNERIFLIPHPHTLFFKKITKIDNI